MSEERNIFELFRLDGRVAIITGGSRGLGFSMALALAEAGATTVITSRAAEICEASAKKIRSQTSTESIALPGDVTQEEDVKRVVGEVHRLFGRVDILVNSAGTNIRHPVEEFSLEEFLNVTNVNLTGSWLCCRAVAPIMKEQRRGSVINVGSALSTVGLAGRSAYCSAKAGVIGMTRALALEWAPFDVRCNALCPGPFLTEMNRPLLEEPERARAVIGQTALKRWGEMYEIRGAVLFLASDASSYITGTALFVDGGWTAQ